MKKIILLKFLLFIVTVLAQGVRSIETGYTISLVRTAKSNTTEFIVASSYEGTVLAYNYDGTKRWENKLSGFMNRDLWAADITGDGKDEIFAANADGSIYCLNSDGILLWSFKNGEVPMNSVCVVTKNNISYVVAGGYDMLVYYLDAQGNQIKVLNSRNYGKDRPFGNFPGDKEFFHTANFIRPFRKSDGTGGLVIHSAIHTSSVSGHLYFFDVLEDKPYLEKKIQTSANLGFLSIVDVDNDNADEFLMGTSSLGNREIFAFDADTDTEEITSLVPLRSKTGGFGYRIVQVTSVLNNDKNQYFISYGQSIILADPGEPIENAEVINNKYSFNDMHRASSTKIILASAQSGGSCIHIIDLTQSSWKNQFSNLAPPGKIASMISNGNKVVTDLENYTKPSSQRQTRLVRMFTENRNGIEDIIEDYKANHSTPVFYNSKFTPFAENWDRSGVTDDYYRNARDGRRRYEWSQNQVLNFFLPQFEDEYGISFWGGHGTDPYIISLPTLKKIIDYGVSNNKAVNIIYPELERHDASAKWMLNDLIFPLAEYARGKNTTIYIRSKHTFWHSIVHKPLWNRLLSGEFADVFVISMEETNTKSTDMSIASRVGLWMSGAVNEWGSRNARDNTSYDRNREISHQNLPNHFLRQTIYHLANGATNQNNFPIDQKYFSVIYDLISSGALYIPNRDELVSISPVHLSMIDPDEEWIEHTSNIKWTVGYAAEDYETPKVIDRINGNWPGAPLNEWDYSYYAAGSRERRLEFLPNFENGLVLFTPPQSGIHTDNDATRGKLTDHMHPMYKNIMKEYFTDGIDYISENGSRFSADQYYTTIENDIKESASKLPLTVSGRVAWACAQTGPKKLRLTVIDGGYINPEKRNASLKFNTVVPVKITDILDGTNFNVDNPSNININVPCGGYRFIDIELAEVFVGSEISIDEIIVNNFPSTIIKGNEVNFEVNYKVTEPRDLVILLRNTEDDKIYDEMSVRVNGAGNENYNFKLTDKINIGDYQWEVELRSIADATVINNQKLVENVRVIHGPIAFWGTFENFDGPFDDSQTIDGDFFFQTRSHFQGSEAINIGPTNNNNNKSLKFETTNYNDEVLSNNGNPIGNNTALVQTLNSSNNTLQDGCYFFTGYVYIPSTYDNGVGAGTQINRVPSKLTFRQLNANPFLVDVDLSEITQRDNWVKIKSLMPISAINVNDSKFVIGVSEEDFPSESPENGGVFYIDDINVSQVSTLSCDEVTLSSNYTTKVAQKLLYPNPAKKRVTLTTVLKGSKIEIINLAGKSVLSANGIVSKPIIDISTLSTGVYFVKFQTENKEIQINKLIVN